MNRHDLTATNWVTTRLTAFVLLAIGIYFAVTLDGTDPVSEWLGGRQRVLSFGLAAAFTLFAAHSMEKNALRVRVAELMEALNQLLYGKDYTRDREAIELLVRALEGTDGHSRETAHRHLVRLTGLQFAPDPFVWRAWWSANEKTWTSRAASRGEGEPSPGARAPDAPKPDAAKP